MSRREKGARRIFQMVRPHWVRIVWAVIFSGIVSALQGALAWAVQPAVDNVFIEGREQVLLLLAIASFFIFVLKGGFTFAQNYLMNSVGAKIVRDLRNDLYAHMVYLPMSHYGSDTTGSMLSRVINDAQSFRNLLAFRVKDLFLSIGTIVVLVGVAMYRRWDLTIMAIVVLPPAVIGISWIGKRIKIVSRNAQKKIGAITESLSEGLTGIKIIKSFGTQKMELGRFAVKNQSYYRETMRSTRLQEATNWLMESVAGVGCGLIVYYAGGLVTSGEMSPGEFFSFMAALLMIYAPAKKLAEVHNGFKQAEAYIARIDEIYDIAMEIEGAVEFEGFRREIEYRDVRFRYGGRKEDALKGVCLTVRRGEVVALVGRSGSGKTTLADLLPRFYDPTGGSISLDGVDIRRMTLGSLRAQVGIVSQDVILFNDTVRENIAYGTLGATDAQIEAAARAAYAHEFIMDLPEGYDTEIGEGGDLLSGGQRQRISIARAILKDPPILVLDEATSALDTQSEIYVQRAIDSLLDSSGGAKTIVLIAHRLSTVKRADRIVVMDMGEIVESGTHEELVRAGGIYSRLHELQHGGGQLDLDALPL